MGDDVTSHVRHLIIPMALLVVVMMALLLLLLLLLVVVVVVVQFDKVVWV